MAEQTAAQPVALPVPCPRCGAPGKICKAGANRVWVQCSKFGKDGNCSAISSPEPNKKAALATWARLK
ncbi:hypothetical protein [Amantichitinum ursilacus]|uniref:hypothetical protein n=1 Tax=Amantichitinum ursilacus TaxID=857265 RepID=UPI0006B5E4BC|nr:hypothetical protein [Amantichitinum ursilacus]